MCSVTLGGFKMYHIWKSLSFLIFFMLYLLLGGLFTKDIHMEGGVGPNAAIVRGNSGI